MISRKTNRARGSKYYGRGHQKHGAGTRCGTGNANSIKNAKLKTVPTSKKIYIKFPDFLDQPKYQKYITKMGQRYVIDLTYFHKSYTGFKTIKHLPVKQLKFIAGRSKLTPNVIVKYNTFGSIRVSKSLQGMVTVDRPRGKK